jgi:GT2 family glycosyltransferase
MSRQADQPLDPESDDVPKHCIMIPFLNRHEQVAECLQSLLAQKNSQSYFLLVDDGSNPPAVHSQTLQEFFNRPEVFLIAHPQNQGVSAARNSALHWCRHHQVEIVIMIDSDCVPEANFISEHLRLHRQHPQMACLGGQIVGKGKGLWARLDGAVSWIHSSSHSGREEEFRQVTHPYHLATTNFSLKLDQLPNRDFIFDERLISGEDCLLVRELRRENRGVFFSSTPRIFHQDRQSGREVFRHHYEWGHHQYFIQLGNDLSPRCFHPLYRLLFGTVFLPLLPLFALTGAVLNSRALWQQSRFQLLLWFPLVYGLWFGKGIAVLEAAIRPWQCLRSPRTAVTYEQPLLN